MSIITILLIAIGLSFDSFAVSITTGLIAKDIKFWQATRIAIIMAAFQGLMPLAGWLIGLTVENLVINFDHWIAFGLLFLIGAKMIIESLKPEEKRKEINPYNLLFIVGMAISTSIDALIIGVSFAFIQVNIFLSVLIIGFVTYVVAMLGMLFGKKFGKLFGKRMEIVGGIMLILIGVKILLEHLYS
jgi:putative Mn2+ efflux pump MntP